MGDDDLYALLQHADPETLKMMMDAGLVPQRLATSNGQETAQGRTVGPHNVYVAASPLEHLANAVKQGVQQNLISKQGQGRTAYLKMLGGQGGVPQPPPATPGQPGYDASAGFDDPAGYG